MSFTRGVVRDAVLSARIAGAALASWILPEVTWMPLVRTLGRVHVGPVKAWRSSATPFDDGLASEAGLSARSIAIERFASGHASRLWGLREYLRRRRDPPIEVVGLSHVEQALAARSGAILWVGRFTWASIITKIGLHRAGCPVTHLSRKTHGFGTSPFAVRRLNPIWTRIEERFVRERIVMEPGSETAALRALRQRLNANGVVSITVGDEAVKGTTVPFLDGALRLATGPTNLAARTGAPLLPVFTVREATGRFRVEIEPALEIPAEAVRSERDSHVAEDYAQRLEAWVRQYPGQWLE